MNFQELLIEVRTRGETLKKDVLSEIVKSKTLSDIVSSKAFTGALTRVLETKDEVAIVIGKQIRNLLTIMNVPTKSDLSHIHQRISSMEKTVDKTGARRIAVKPLVKPGQKGAKAKTVHARKPAAKTAGKKSGRGK